MSPGLALYRQIYDYVKQSITDGRFRAGEMIPTEQELMDQFGVSRITTNRALQMLTAEGLVTRRAGLGTFVCDHTPDTRGDHNSSEPQDSGIAQSPPLYRESPLVGFVIPFLDGSFGPTIIQHVEMLLNQRGMSVALSSTQGDQKMEEMAIDRLIACGVKGLIVLPVNGEYYSEAILRLHVQKFPIVLVDKSMPGLPISSVTSDNFAATKALTNHLISLGHRNICFFSPAPSGTSTLVERYNGFLDSLNDHGIAMKAEYQLTTILSGTYSKKLDDPQIERVARFLEQHPEVTAVLAADDQLAEHVLAAASRMGRNVPEALSIACFDGRGVKDLYWNFTHAIQDEAEMARQCVRILDELWSGNQHHGPEAITLACKLHVGQSTSSVAIKKVNAQ